MRSNRYGVVLCRPPCGQALDDLERFVNTAEGATEEAREEALVSAAQTMKRLGGMKRSYNVEIKLMSDAAAKVHHGHSVASQSYAPNLEDEFRSFGHELMKFDWVESPGLCGRRGESRTRVSTSMGH